MKKIFRSGEPRYILDAEMADRILQTCYQACGREANSVPLALLTSYSSYRRERFSLQKSALAVILVLFLLLPLLFIDPVIRVTKISGSDSTPVYDITVTSFIPVYQVSATIGEHRFPITETATNRYEVTPKTSGTMSVMVKLLNRQYETVEVEIEGVDAYPPVLERTETFDDCVDFYFTDDYSGIDFLNITVVYEDGRSSAFSFDSETGCLSVPFPEMLTEITVPDKYGNEYYVHLKAESTSKQTEDR